MSINYLIEMHWKQGLQPLQSMAVKIALYAACFACTAH